MNKADYPILEFDESRTALIDPNNYKKPIDGLPDTCVLCFFHEVIAQVCAGKAPIAQLNSEMGKLPIYIVEDAQGAVTVAHPGLGGPMAAAITEELIALGCRKFIACGGAGVLNSTIDVGHVVIPTAAVRDEGTSYHYLPPSREVVVRPEPIAAIEATLDQHNIPYLKGKTWTTDAIYRETPARIAARKKEGCITVEMETASFLAVAQFRDVIFGQILYGGDNVGDEVWDHRDWVHGHASTREKLFWLALEAVLKL